MISKVKLQAPQSLYVHISTYMYYQIPKHAFAWIKGKVDSVYRYGQYQCKCTIVLNTLMRVTESSLIMRLSREAVKQQHKPTPNVDTRRPMSPPPLSSCPGCFWQFCLIERHVFIERCRPQRIEALLCDRQRNTPA